MNPCNGSFRLGLYRVACKNRRRDISPNKMEDARTNSRRKIFWLLLPFLSCLLLYAPVISHVPFYYDDYPHFVENQKILHPKKVSDVFYNGFQETRPLYNLSLAVQAKLFGKSALAGHLINLDLFLACGVLVLVLILRLTSSLPTAALVATIFLIHPVAIETVVYMNSRSGLMAFFFSLLAWLTIEKKLFAGILCLVLAILCKEDGAGSVLVALALLYHRESLEPRKGVAILCAGLTLPLLYLVFPSPHHDSIGGVVDTWHHYLFFQGLNLPLHLSMFVFPQPLAFNRDLPAWSLQPWVFTVGWVLLLALGACVWKHRRHLMAFAVAWMILALVPTHSVMPLLDIQATRMLFPALAGAGLMLSMLGAYLFRVHRKVGIAWMVCLLVLLSTLTYQELHLWKNPRALWEKNVKIAPSRWRLWLNLAIEYAEHREWSKAKRAVDQAFVLAPQESSVIYNRAAVYFSEPLEKEKVAESFAHLRALVSKNPQHVRGAALLRMFDQKRAFH